jgi:hypothetical protein
MYCGKFEDVMPFSKEEADKYINYIKQTLQEGKDHSYTNFEICTLRTIKALQQENKELREKLEKCADEFGEIVWENASLQCRIKEKDKVQGVEG